MEWRTAKWHNGAESREMARNDGWVMARRPGRMPYTIMAKEWDTLPSVEDGRALSEQYYASLNEEAKRIGE